MKTISIENITFGYHKNKPMFENLSFEIKSPYKDKGYIVALMGTSGSGKSTLLKLILGIEKPQLGKITTNPQKPTIAYLPQEPVLFEHLSLLENAKYFANTSVYKHRFDENVFNDLVDALNMKEIIYSKQSVTALSGGQKQRLSLIRALSIRPDILLLDEPTTGLDAEIKLQFLNKLRELTIYYNLLVIYVTHHKLETELLVDEIVYLPKGNQNKPIKQLFQNTIAAFIKTPPLLEALKVFNYPKPNSIRVKVQDNKIEVTNDEQDSFIIAIPSNTIHFHNEGIPVELVSQNALFSVLRLGNVASQFLTIDTIEYNTQYSFIVLEGQFHQYDNQGFFIKNIQLKNNQII